MPQDLTPDERLLVQRALGCDVPRKSAAATRNRIAVHVEGPNMPVMKGLEERGLVLEDATEHYGKMRVFRVSLAGAEAYGKKLKPALRFEHLKPAEPKETATEQAPIAA